jgi:hypothetical protein
MIEYTTLVMTFMTFLWVQEIRNVTLVIFHWAQTVDSDHLHILSVVRHVCNISDYLEIFHREAQNQLSISFTCSMYSTMNQTQ